MDAIVDSLQIYQRLRSAKLDDKPAREIASIFQQVVHDHTVTKRDIEQLRHDLELKIEQSKNNLIIWVAGIFMAQLGLIAALFKLLK